MAYDPKIHHRRSIRLQSWDYGWPWWYFTTICTAGRECLFGRVANDKMQLNFHGDVVREEWMKTPSVRPEVDLDEFVFMPNHLHGIVIINNVRDEHEPSVGAHGRAPLRREPRSLGAFVAGFKSIVTKRVNILRGTPGLPVWQRGFYDHIIRNERDLHRIRTYIANNPLQWALDEENPGGTAELVERWHVPR